VEDSTGNLTVRRPGTFYTQAKRKDGGHVFIALVIVGSLLVLDLLTLWFGVDSRDGRDWEHPS
jgi:hypothetical protein